MDLQLDGKVVFIAGSSRGIGKACAAAFYAEGASVVITSRSQSSAQRAADDIGSGGSGRVLALGGDLATDSGIQRALEATIARCDRIDIIVGCIGDGRGKMGWEQGASGWAETFEVNLWPAVRLCEHGIPFLPRGTGAIVLIGSITGRERLGPVAYGTAKAALAAYSTRLAAEVASLGLRVLCVEPGNVLVPGGRWEERVRDEPVALTTMLERETLLHRLGTPEEIADVVCFLASERASFMTATRVVVDGGQTHD